MPVMNIADKKFMENVHCRGVEKQWLRQPVWEVSNTASHSSSVLSLLFVTVDGSPANIEEN